MDVLKTHGRFTIECYHDGVLLWTDYADNLVTNEGMNFMLDVMFNTEAQISWYVIIVESDTTAAAGMTYATPVFTECEAYDEATRPAFTTAAASSQSVTNSASKAEFTMNDSKTLYGAAIVGGDDTIGDTAGGGVLFSYAKFTASKSVASGQVMRVSYTTGLS
jgi:hypothetical protein